MPCEELNVLGVPRLKCRRVRLSAVLLARSSLRGAASIRHAKCESVMKRQILWMIPVLLVVGLIIKNWSWSVTEDQLVGTYINTNYSQTKCCVEAPHEPDTLRLMADGTMTSGFYGTGTWELKRGGSAVEWHYPYEYGTAGYSASIDNEIGQPIRLILNWDWDHHYKKVE